MTPAGTANKLGVKQSSAKSELSLSPSEKVSGDLQVVQTGTQEATGKEASQR